MSPHFKAKELLLLLPVLGFVGVAFYWTRTGSSGRVGMFDGKTFSRGPYIESVKFETASGDKREQGFSHTITVTLNHSWPIPAHWRSCCTSYQVYDAFDKPLPTKNSLLNPAHANYAAALGATLWKREDKSSTIGQKRTWDGYGRLEQHDGKFTFTRNLALQNAGTQGTIELNDAYVIAGQEVINLHKVLRKAGDKLTFDNSHTTGGILLSATTNLWRDVTGTGTPSGKMASNVTIDDMIDVNLKVRCTPSTASVLPNFDIHDVELVDGKGRVYRMGRPGLWWLPMKPLSTVSPSGEYQLSPAIKLDTGSGFRPPNPLTLRSKVSINHQWPLLFSIKLPPLIRQ